MYRSVRFISCLAMLVGLSTTSLSAQPIDGKAPPTTKDLANNAGLGDTGVKDGVSLVILRAEVMLDRLHASPGVIDGRGGANFVHALEVYAKAKHITVAKGLNDKIWAALLAENGKPVLMEHVLTDTEVKGPFFPDLPKDYSDLAKLKTIGYRSVSQKLGAEFHMGEELLAALICGRPLGKNFRQRCTVGAVICSAFECGR